ncbi:MAG: hypothetical protein GQ549_03410 [Gammaproteobacteria bacterium]|nr:hypothetical protein [Gammaproteobacteria bacterium]
MNNSRLLFVFALSFILTACIQPAEDPKSVADRYWAFLQAGNSTEAEKLISVNSHQIAQEHTRRIKPNIQLKNGGAKTVVNTTITTINPDTGYSQSETFDTVLIFQNGQWKVDVGQSQIPPAPDAKEEELQQLADELSESMQKNIESIDEAMGEGMQLFNDALREGSKEMGDSMLQLMNELNSSMKKSIDKMKQRREQQTQEPPQQQPPQTQPDPRQGEGMI